MTIAAGIFLIAVGAVLRYATNFHVQEVDMDTVGLILMIAGAAGLVLAFFQEMIWTDRVRRREVAGEAPVRRERVVERRPDEY
jgi:hypothetical protein